MTAETWVGAGWWSAAGRVVLGAVVLLATAAQITPARERGEAAPPDPGPAPADTVGRGEAIVSGLAAYMEEKGGDIVAALELMPARSYDDVLAEGQPTFRHQAAHVARSNFNVCSVMSPAVERPGTPTEPGAPKDELVEAAAASFAFCRRVLDRIGDGALADSVHLSAGRSVSVARLAFFLAGNWADHYGHFATHLRREGITPPSAEREGREQREGDGRGG